MRYHVQENALFSAQNVTPAIQDTLQHMVQGDEAVLDWGFYTIGSPITIANATRLQYCTMTKGPSGQVRFSGQSAQYRPACLSPVNTLLLSMAQIAAGFCPIKYRI